MDGEDEDEDLRCIVMIPPKESIIVNRTTARGQILANNPVILN